MDQTPNLLLPYIMAAQGQKHVTHNEAIRALDAIVQLAVLDRDLAAPPVSPVDGNRYIVAAGPTGIWSGHESQIAAFQDGAWMFHPPREGWIAWVADEDKIVAWDGAQWVLAGGESLNPTPLVGVNTTADVSNRLAVASANTLFTHAGSDHRVKVNKAGAGATASLLFQDAFSGRAELGLAGDDKLRFKVSADGAIWRDALIADQTTGQVSMPFGLADVGFDVVLIAGQSNAQGAGQSFDARIDAIDPRVSEFVSGGSYADSVVQAVDPLGGGVLGAIGHAVTFARLYAASLPTNRRVLLVPCAVSGTGFSIGVAPGYWTAGVPGGQGYEFAIQQANKAVRQGPNNRFAGVVWLQGESDSSVAATYAAKLDALIAGLRGRILGAANSWFLVGGMTPEGVSLAGLTAIAAIHVATPSRNGRCGYFSGQPGYVNSHITDQLHYNALGQRFLARSAFAALTTALANVSGTANPTVPAAVTGLLAGQVTANSIALTWIALASQPLDYHVQYKASASSTWATFQHPASANEAVVVTGLQAGSAYDFRISGVNHSGLGTYSAIVTASTSSAFLLDAFTTTVTHAFSVRRLKSAYTGPLIRVRRSSDNAEQDIGMTVAHVLDTSALTSFAGAGAAFVTKWYDQSGNARDAVQTDTTKQPRIVNAGALDTINGICMPRWVAAAGLLAPTGHPVSASWSRFGVAQTVGGNNILSNLGTYLWLLSGQLQIYDPPFQLNGGAPGTTLNTIGATQNFTSKATSVYLNGAVTTGTSNGTGPSTGAFGLGTFDNFNSLLANGYIGEAFSLAGVATVAEVAATQTSQKVYFGTP